MNILLLRPGDNWLDATTVHITDHRADHLRQVLRSAEGESIRVGVVGGQRGDARVEAIDASGVTLRVALNEPPPPRHRFDIVLALPRPKMLRRILRTVAEYGVCNLHLINSARVEKSYWQSPLLAPERIEEALLAGMERSRDTIAPVVQLHPRFRPFIEDELGEICAGRPCWITDLGAPQALADVPAGDAVVMVGPEGGFVPFEIDLVCSIIARRVHLGGRTLSVDTALTCALAQGLTSVSTAPS